MMIKIIQYAKYSMFFLLIMLTSFSLFAVENGSYDACFQEKTNAKEIGNAIESLSYKNIKPEYLYVRSQCFFKLNKYDLSLADINKLIKFNPHYPYAHILRGKIFLAKKDYFSAINDFQYSIDNELSYGDADAHVFLVKAYKESGKVKEAENHLLKVLNISDLTGDEIKTDIELIRKNYNEIKLFIALKQLYMDLSDVEKAIEILKIGVAQNNGSIKLFDSLVFLLQKNKQIDLADEYIKSRCDIPLIVNSMFCQQEKQDKKKNG